MFYDEENHTFGMSYINQFVISEDAQIECSGAYEINDSYPNDVNRSIDNHFELNKENEGKSSNLTYKMHLNYFIQFV